MRFYIFSDLNSKTTPQSVAVTINTNYLSAIGLGSRIGAHRTGKLLTIFGYFTVNNSIPSGTTIITFPNDIQVISMQYIQVYTSANTIVGRLENDGDHGLKATNIGSSGNFCYILATVVLQ